MYGLGRLGARWWFAAALSLGVALLLMAPGLFGHATLSGDSAIHIRWQAQYGPLVWHEMPYPRWLPGMNHGLGSPAFFFYPPLLQWVGAAVEPLFAGPGNATLRTAIALWLLSAFGGVGTWAWLRALRLDGAAALLGALVYLLLPYRAYFDIYQRGALPELAGISVMPWLLAAAQRLHNGARGGWGGYALAVGLILYSHLPSAEMGLLFASFYLLVLPARGERLRFWLRAGSATVAGFMIGALCIATALGLLGFIVDPGNMWGERQQPVHWLLFGAEPWVDPGVKSVTVFLWLLGLAMVGPLTWLARPEQGTPGLRRIIWFLCASVLVVLVLNTAPTRPFWALQTPLSRIQFPLRLLSLHLLAFAGLAAIALDRAAVAGRTRWRHLPWLAAGALLLLDVALFVAHARHARNPVPDNAAIVASTWDTGEYVLGDVGAAERRLAGRPAVGLDAPVLARAIRWRSRDLAIDVAAPAATRLALGQFAFSGWRCRIDGGAWAPAARLPLPLNLPVCTVPAGRHLLEATLPATPIERAGGILTALGLLLALAELAGLLRRLRLSAD